MFAVVVTGPPGAGKTASLTALSDALTDDQIAHAAIDVDEVAWAYPFPDLMQRCGHLRASCDAHRRAGHDLVLVAEVIESPAHLEDVLASVGADDHLLARLEATPATLRQRIVAREPPGWSSLAYLLDYAERTLVSLASLEAHLVMSSEALTTSQITDRIRSARPEKLSRGS